MGDGTEESPYMRQDVVRLIEENGGTAEGLDLKSKWFEKGIELRGINLEGIILDKAMFLINTNRSKRDCPFRGLILKGYIWKGHLYAMPILRKLNLMTLILIVLI